MKLPLQSSPQSPEPSAGASFRITIGVALGFIGMTLILLNAAQWPSPLPCAGHPPKTPANGH